MTREARAIRTAGAMLATYAILWFKVVPLPFVSEDAMDQIVPCLPFNLLITFGSYCLWELGWGILTFGDCEGAYEELMREISMAKDDLRAKGVSVD